MNSDSIFKKHENRKIIIFGAGADGILFYKLNINRMRFCYFVDNGDIEGHTVFGEPLHDFCYLKNNYEGELIVVTSSKYCEEIEKQLIQGGYIKEINYCIWNGKQSEDIYEDKEQNIKALVDLNIKLWKNDSMKHGDNIILIPYRNTYEMVYAPWSYCANILAAKYDASIYCIGGENDPLDEELYKIYESFNVCGYIDDTPSAEQRMEIARIFDEVWGKIKTVSDLNNITIYGECYGTDILRDYFRRTFPQIYLDDYNLKKQIKTMIGYVVFWHNYFKANEKIKAVIVWDGLYDREGIIRKIAYGYNIPVYSIVNTAYKRWGYNEMLNFEYYKKFYYMLDENEQKLGLQWAKNKMCKHLEGRTKDEMVRRQVFEVGYQKSLIKKSDKIKVMICPHYSEDDAYPYGADMLFNDLWDWLDYLGEMSDKLDYDWYLKLHPIEKPFGDYLIDKFLEKHNKITKLPKYVSPKQLKEEGIQYALTIHGSMGYEYPYIGIDVINAGYNPHIAFDFDYNPRSKQEYEELLCNLPKQNKKIDKNEILQFYCIHFGYLIPWDNWMNRQIFKNKILQDVRGLIGSESVVSTELFRLYAEEITEERHNELLAFYKGILDEMDSYKVGVFAKRELPD